MKTAGCSPAPEDGSRVLQLNSFSVIVIVFSP